MDADEDVPIARPVEALAYATPRGEHEVPEFVPLAEAALDRRASIREVARPFRLPSVAAEYVRRSLGRRHSPEAAGDACLRCGATTHGAVVYLWSFVVPNRWWITVRDRRVKGYVETCHAWCDACAAPLWQRSRRLARANRIAGFLVIAGGTALVLAFVVPLLVGIGSRERLSPSDAAARAGVWIGLVGIATLVGGIVLATTADAYARLRVPRAVRRALPRWLRYERFVGAFDRGGLRDP